MIKRILVALDGSDASLAALAEAARWAALAGAELEGMFVEDEMRFLFFPALTYMEGGVAVPTPLPEEEYRKVETQVRAEGEAIRKTFQETLAARPGVRGDFATTRGDINAVLAEEARAADLVVIGRRGKRLKQNRSKRPGPTTEAMVHDSHRPVLVVPAAPRAKGMVLFAYDGSKAAQRVVVPGAYLASLEKAPTSVLTCDDDAESARKTQASLLRYLGAYGLEPRALIEKGDPTRLIVDKANATGAGMIVMGAFGHNPIRELLFGSTTLMVLEKAPCPVLMMA